MPLPTARAALGDEDVAIVIRLRRSVSIHALSEGNGFALTELEGAIGAFRHEVHPFVHAAAIQLAHGVTVSGVENALIDEHGPEGLARWYAFVASLEGAGLLEYTVQHGDRTILRCTPAAAGRLDLRPAPAQSLRLSRFAYVVRDGTCTLLESPLSRGRLELLHGAVGALVILLHTERSRDDVLRSLGDECEPWLDASLSLLIAAGVVLCFDGQGATAEDQSLAARHWEFADLVFHARSRTSRADQRVGGTYRFSDVDPPPPIKSAMSPILIPLAQPDLAALTVADEPLSSVMERRQSARRQGTEPIDLKQLGEFLYRTARARPAEPDEDAREQHHRFRRRVYPGGGACHPLEVYVVVSRCHGLEPGIYRYDPDSHALEPIPDLADEAQTLLRQVSVPMDDGTPTQLLLVITARFRRMSWKYEGNAYALILQEVGVLYEAMYLVATAMRLAPCAVGGGDATHFASIIGTDPLEEASVGAFTLGSLG